MLKINKINNSKNHVYNTKTNTSFLFGSEEIELIKNKDPEFMNYLEKIQFDKKKINWLDIKIPLIKLYNIKYNFLLKWTEKIVYILFLILFCSLAILYVVKPQYISVKINEILHAKIDFPKLLLIILISTIVHEAAHIISAINRKVMIPTCGINFKMFIPFPLPYVDLTGITWIKSKKKKIEILTSGILMNFFLAMICLLISIVFKNNFFNLCSLYNISIVFANLMFYIKLDGYYIIESYYETKIITYKLNDFKGKYNFICVYIYITLIIFIIICIINLLQFF